MINNTYTNKQQFAKESDDVEGEYILLGTLGMKPDKEYIDKQIEEVLFGDKGFEDESLAHTLLIDINEHLDNFNHKIYEVIGYKNYENLKNLFANLICSRMGTKKSWTKKELHNLTIRWNIFDDFEFSIHNTKSKQILALFMGFRSNIRKFLDKNKDDHFYEEWIEREEQNINRHDYNEYYTTESMIVNLFDISQPYFDAEGDELYHYDAFHFFDDLGLKRR